MIDPGWRFPDAPLRASVVTTGAAGLIAVVAVASMMHMSLPLGELYPVKAAALFGVGMLIAIGFVRDHHPFARFGPANTATTARAMLVALVAGMVGERGMPPVAVAAAGVALAATALDGLDGWLARRTGMITDFGARFDMETDAVLIMVLAILAWRFGKAGAWVLLCGLLRYLFVAAGWWWPSLRQPLPPSLRRKAICVVQVVGLGLAIVPAITRPASTLVAAITLAALCYSFLVDVRWLVLQPLTVGRTLSG